MFNGQVNRVKSPSTIPPKSRPMTRWWLLVILLAGGLLRWGVGAASSFPVGEGGLYYQTTQTIQETPFPPPTTIAYNGRDVPNLHPPLAFYAAAGLASIPGVSLLAVFRWLPWALSLLTLLAFYRLARDMLDDDRRTLLATGLFMLLPGAYSGILGGPGVVGAAGMLLALLSLLAVRRVLDASGLGRVTVAALWLMLTALIAPVWAVFVGFSALALLALRAPDVMRSVRLFAVLVVAAAVAAGWVYYIQRVHTLEPLNAVVLAELDGQALQGRLALLAGGDFGFTQEPLVRIAGALSVLAVFVGIAQRRFDLVVWLLAILLLPIVEIEQAVIPLALLLAVGVDYLLITGIGSFRRPRRLASDGETVLDPGSNRAVYVAYAALAGVLVLMAANVARASTVQELNLRVLSPEDREALTWMQENLSRQRNATVLVINGQSDWRSDVLGEWFPALTGMQSSATVHTARLTSEVLFKGQVTRYQALQSCTSVACLQNQTPTEAVNVYIYLASDVGGALRADLLDDSDTNPYRPVYPTFNRGAIERRPAVFQRRN